MCRKRPFPRLLFPLFPLLRIEWERGKPLFMRCSHCSHCSHAKTQGGEERGHGCVHACAPFRASVWHRWGSVTEGRGRVKSLRHTDRKPTGPLNFCARRFWGEGVPLLAWLWAALIWCGIQCPMCPQLPPLFRHVPPLYENEPLNVPPHAPGFRHTSAHVRALVKATSHRGKEKGRTVVEPCGLVCGARGRNRTGTPCGGGF